MSARLAKIQEFSHLSFHTSQKEINEISVVSQKSAIQVLVQVVKVYICHIIGSCFFKARRINI